MSQFLSYALPGIPYGCAYALMAVGLVLTYKASGVFNLAFGAQAYVSALVFYVAVAQRLAEVGGVRGGGRACSARPSASCSTGCCSATPAPPRRS